MSHLQKRTFIEPGLRIKKNNSIPPKNCLLIGEGALCSFYNENGKSTIELQEKLHKKLKKELLVKKEKKINPHRI